MLDSFAMILLVFMGLRDDRLAPGEPQKSLFRTRDTDAGTVKPMPANPAWAWEETDRNVSE